MNKLSLRGFSAWITIDGDSLPVYQQETTATNCSAWIPSTPGQTFSVWWKDDSKARIATSGHVFIDGHDVASAIMRPGRSKPVERSDDEKLADKNDPTLQDVGTIKIEISRVKLGDEVPFKGYDAQDPRVVHEKAKKLGAHCTSYGPTKRSSPSRTVAVSTVPYDPDSPSPYVTFLFRYRSEDLLRANGVIGNNQRKRNLPDDNDEVIQISDSDDEKEKADKDSPVKKRARLEAGDNETVSEPPPGGDTETTGDAEPGAEDGALSNDIDMDDSQFDFGAPTLLQQDKSQEEQSQNQVDDDSQLTFGTPSLLQQDNEECSQLRSTKEDQQAAANSENVDKASGSTVPIFGENSVGESQVDIDESTTMTEESQAY